MTRARPAARTLPAVLLSGLLACGGGGDGAPEPPPPPPDLTGARVMLVPARPDAPPTLDRELGFWLTDRAPATEWILPEEIEAAVERNPASRFRLGAPRRLVDLGGGNRRIQDPLYGDLRRLGAILDAGLALVPLGSRARTDSLGVALELTAALVSVRGGRVLWLYTVAGEPAAPGEEPSVPSAAAALARTLIRETG